jgi:putative ABC transport system substrate-binding protein
VNIGRRAANAGAFALMLTAGLGPARAAPRRIGLLSIAEAYIRWPEWRAFVDELARLGFVQGRDVEYLSRHAGTYDEPQSSQRLMAAAAELVALRVDLIYAVEVSATALAAQRVTQTVPVIFDRAWFDPVETGLVSNLARPGRNVTGNAVLGVELESKAIEALVATVGTKAPIGLVQSTAVRSWPNYERLERARAAIGRALGVQLEVFEADSVRQLGVELARMRRLGLRGVKIDDPEEFVGRREEVAAMFTANRLAAVSTEVDFARAGLLIGLGWDVEEIARRSAGYANRILRGARPGDLPVEQVTKFKLVVNRRTARALDLTLPPALLARADEVID